MVYLTVNSYQVISFTVSTLCGHNNACLLLKSGEVWNFLPATK